jgi:hypothetical protein
MKQKTFPESIEINLQNSAKKQIKFKPFFFVIQGDEKKVPTTET